MLRNNMRNTKIKVFSWMKREHRTLRQVSSKKIMSANCCKKSTANIMTVAAVQKITFLSQTKHRTGQVVTSAKETKSVFTDTSDQIHLRGDIHSSIYIFKTATVQSSKL
jgi:hypothetical protein